jgi:hypothetical protein
MSHCNRTVLVLIPNHLTSTHVPRRILLTIHRSNQPAVPQSPQTVLRLCTTVGGFSAIAIVSTDIASITLNSPLATHYILSSVLSSTKLVLAPWWWWWWWWCLSFINALYYRTCQHALITHVITLSSRTLKPKFKHKATANPTHTTRGPVMASKSLPLRSRINFMRYMYTP